MNESDYRSDRPVVGITMGDPAGIGPEVIIKSLSDRSVDRKVRPIVIGDIGLLEKISRALGARSSFVEFSTSKAVENGAIEVVDLKKFLEALEIGKVSKLAGHAAGEYIQRSVAMWKEGTIDAVCTAPINKESLALAGFDFPGHTEFFAALTGTDRFAMSFFAEKLRVVLLSTHLPLRDAIRKVNKDAIGELLRFTDLHLSKLLKRKVKIAVAGLNPHASENGMFGREEREEIEPAIQECAAEGVDVSGPYSPDTVFLRCHQGEFDAVIAHYHDQATIPVKALAFGAAVNVTLGLPFIRTSVDHGTAFDIASKGIADASSMKAAILLAGELAGARAIQK
jgi:4-phospho-D-threonate 3-dehydrogenase / 4-phospho-D-erythronate 3-dehydrogenase